MGVVRNVKEEREIKKFLPPTTVPLVDPTLKQLLRRDVKDVKRENKCQITDSNLTGTG